MYKNKHSFFTFAFVMCNLIHVHGLSLIPSPKSTESTLKSDLDLNHKL